MSKHDAKVDGLLRRAVRHKMTHLIVAAVIGAAIAVGYLLGAAA